MINKQIIAPMDSFESTILSRPLIKETVIYEENVYDQPIQKITSNLPLKSSSPSVLLHRNVNPEGLWSSFVWINIEPALIVIQMIVLSWQVESSYCETACMKCPVRK